MPTHSTLSKKPVVLCILDGWGDSENLEYNAPKLAHTPTFDTLKSTFPNSHLLASGLSVGLPDGQMGNSEVGHLNIGAGRVVMQNLPKINQACTDKSYQQTQAFQSYTNALKETGGSAHLLCLLSDGGVHAHLNHLSEMANAIIAMDIPVILHAFTDGRDTAPKSALQYITDLNAKTSAKIGTICGRYWAMDRDSNWDRVKISHDAIALGTSHHHAASATNAVEIAYADKITDEFINPTIIGDYDGMKDGDGVFCLNFRSDRVRQILTTLLDPNFSDFPRKEVSMVKPLGMVTYSSQHDKYMDILFPPVALTHTLGQLVSDAGMKQIRTAETEKYPHVTFFFNGGIEQPLAGEERLLSPSPKVATYDLQPEMSAFDVTDKLIERLSTNDVDMVILNFANPDMVGHSGDLDATIKACQAVDTCLSRVWETVKNLNGVLLVTADHGNCDIMYDEIKKEPHTAHTLNPVNFIVCGAGDVQLQDGVLGDIAPTMLKLLGIKHPKQMTGKCLIS